MTRRPERHDIEVVYRRELETDLIEYLAKIKGLSLRKATDVYYKSKLSEMIQTGQYGIDNLDFKYLAEDLVENEPELFDDAASPSSKNGTENSPKSSSSQDNNGIE